MKLEDLNTTELIQAYSGIIKQLKRRGVIRTKNLLGDLGEYLAIEHFNNTAGMSNLQAAPAELKTLMQSAETETDTVSKQRQEI